MLTAHTVKEGARIAGISESRMYALMKEPSFQNRLREESGALLKITSKRLSEKTGSAVAVLCGVMEDENAPVQARVAAADKVIGHALKINERVDVIARLEELEKMVANDA